MAHEEAAFSRKHSAVSENQHQHQHQHQRPFTAEPLHGADAEDAEVEKGLSRNHGKPDDEQERVQQRAEALAIKLAQTYEELTRLLERNPGFKRQENRNDSPQRTPMAQRENGPSALNARQSGMRWVEVGYQGRG